MKVIIIGGVAGGATAAARIRRLDEKAEIVILERSGFVSYANCGLPYYIGGGITDPEELTLQTPQGFWNRFRVDVRVRHEATAIDPAGKQVTVKNLETGEVTVGAMTSFSWPRGPPPPGPRCLGWTVPGCFPCGRWRTRSGFGRLWSGTGPKPRCWPAGASSAWRWRKIWRRWEWRSRFCSGFPS